MFLDQILIWSKYDKLAKECYVKSLGAKIKLYPIGVVSLILKDVGQPRQVDTIRKLEAAGIIPRATYRLNEKRRYDRYQIESLVTSFIEAHAVRGKRDAKMTFREKLKDISFPRFLEAKEKLKKEIKNVKEESCKGKKGH